MTTVYLAGPMTGHPHYNVASFEYYAARWRDAGYDVGTPFDANSTVWQRHFGRPFDPYKDTCDYGHPILREMFAADVALMLSGDAVALLPGWQASKGVSRELPIAELFHLAIYDAQTFKPLPTETILQEAQRLVHGDRGEAYGHPIVDYGRTGRIWGAVLGIPDIDPRLCCLMMAGVKISREVQSHKRDNLTDLAGYAECAAMVADKQAEPTP